jgi:predicted transcriptional regulator
MSTLNRILVLNTLIKHETLTLNDLGKEENLGLTPDGQHLIFLLDELEEGRYIQKLNGTDLCTYTITDKGITEGKRLQAT